MALQRTIGRGAAAAALTGLLGSCAAPAPAGTSAPVIEPSSLAAEITALREQQAQVAEAVRGLQGQVEALTALLERVERAAADEATSIRSSTAAAPETAVVAEPAPGPPAERPSVSGTSQESSPASNYVAVARRLIEDEDLATAVRVLNLAADLDAELDEIYFQRGVARHLLQSYADAIEDFQTAIQRTTRQDMRYICLYNQACGLARMGRKEEAMKKLVQSDEAGFRDLLDQMSTDPDLDSLRELGEFRDFAMMLRTR